MIALFGSYLGGGYIKPELFGRRMFTVSEERKRYSIKVAHRIKSRGQIVVERLDLQAAHTHMMLQDNIMEPGKDSFLLSRKRMRVPPSYFLPPLTPKQELHSNCPHRPNN